MLALSAVAATLAFVVTARHESALWTADPSRPLVDAWASYVEAGSSGTRITRSSHPARIQAVVEDGVAAYRMSTLPSDRDRYSSGAQRTELGQGNPARPFNDGSGERQMQAGEERWIAERLLMPRSVRSGGFRPRSFFVLNQFKMEGSGGPPVALAFDRNRLVVRRAAFPASRSVGHKDLGRSAVVPRNRWVRVVWHVKWSTTSDGLIEVFADLGRGFRRIVRYRGWTLKHAAPGQRPAVHSRIGVYREAVPTPTTVYFSTYAVAASRAAAEQSARF